MGSGAMARLALAAALLCLLAVAADISPDAEFSLAGGSPAQHGDRVAREAQPANRNEGEKKQRASDVENRDRMVRMRDDKDKYLESLLKERKNVFEKKIAEFNVLVAEERKIRLERR